MQEAAKVAQANASLSEDYELAAHLGSEIESRAAREAGLAR